MNRYEAALFGVAVGAVGNGRRKAIALVSAILARGPRRDKKVSWVALFQAQRGLDLFEKAVPGFSRWVFKSGWEKDREFLWILGEIGGACIQDKRNAPKMWTEPADGECEE